MPDGSTSVKGGVLLLVAEDSIRKTLPLRLKAAGAELKKIAVIEKFLTIPDNLQEIRAAARELGAKLVVIDPLMAFLGRNSSGDQAVRQALTPLKGMAEQLNAAVVLVRHLTKSGSKQSLYRAGGSIGIIGAARFGLLVGLEPSDPNLRVLVQYKNSLGPKAPSLIFEPVSKRDQVRIEWRGECDCTAEDVLGAKPSQDSKVDEAMDFLSDILADGPVEEAKIRRLAAAEGISLRTTDRAKHNLGVESSRKGWGPGSKCFWAIPEKDEDD
jgi:hypothetical protein